MNNFNLPSGSSWRDTTLSSTLDNALFFQVLKTVLPFLKENVCIAHEKEENMAYAVGSLSHVSLLETHSGKSVGSLCSSEQGAGKKSLFSNRHHRCKNYFPFQIKQFLP